MPFKLKNDLVHIRSAALEAVDPGRAVRAALRLEPAAAGRPTLVVRGRRFPLEPRGRLLLVAAGKAAVAMAAAAERLLGEALSGGIVVTRSGHAAGQRLGPSVQLFEAGHPLPDAHGERAARAVEGLVSGLGTTDHLLVLLSGGASALLPAPVEGVSLADLQELTGLLLRSGAAIQEINALRKHLDRLKGGQLARLAAPARVTALILSDVVGDRLDVIASGLTAPDSTGYATALAVLEKYRLAPQVSPAIMAALQAGSRGLRPETVKAEDPLFARVHNEVIASNRLAAVAAVAAAGNLGYHALLLTTFLEGEAREAGKFAAALVRAELRDREPLPRPACLVLGGETTVTLRGQGRGGRNQELALAAALALENEPGWALMALATDGSDGPTDSAGALVDGQTVPRAARLGLAALAALAENDSYPFLEAAGAQMRTGPTGTNVNDLLVILVE